MAKNKKTDKEFTPKITHIMADGSVRDSIEGYEVPVNDYTEICYQMLAKLAERKKTTTA